MSRPEGTTLSRPPPIPGTPLPELPYRTGDVIAGRYVIESLLGRGGGGAVLGVHDRVTQKRRALKLHAPRVKRLEGAGADTGGWSWRLRREFYVLAQLRHPNIVRVHDWGEDRSFPYYTMDHIAGQDAADLERVTPEQVVDLLLALTSALGLIDARGFVHQDIKPRNIRIPERGGGDADRPLLGAMLMDFGLIAPAAAELDVGLTAEFELESSRTVREPDERSIGGPRRGVSGTVGFIAPEVLLGAPADGRSDLYAVGATAHLLLVGQLPPHGGYTGFPARLEHLPPALAALVGELLAGDPRRRPADAAELTERLAALSPASARLTAQLAPSYLAAPRLIGRDAELGALRRAWSHTQGGHGGPVYVVGSPGLGKSRLIEAFALEMRISGAQVLQAGAELRQGTPFSAVRQVLRQAAAVDLVVPPEAGGQADPEETAALRGLVAGRLAHAALPAAQLSVVKRAVAGWARRTSERQPTVIVIDDLFWCDEGSIAVFEHLANCARELRLLVLCSLRPDTGDDAAAQLERLRRGALGVLELSALDREGVRALLQAIFGPVEVHQRLLERWHQASAGVPYLGVEIARDLHERGLVTFEAGRWRLPRTLEGVGLPGSLDEALGERLARLSAQARRVAQLAAVAGSPAELSSLEALAGLDEASLFAALDELDERMVAHTHAGRLRFLHTRVEELLYDETDPLERESHHRRLGELLRRRHARTPDGSPERSALGRAVGHHLARGGLGVDRQAVGWLKEAGDQAYEAGGFADALGPLREAATLLERDGRGDASGRGAQATPELLAIWERLAMSSYLYDLELAVRSFEKLRRALDHRSRWSLVGERQSTVGARVAVLGGLVKSTTGRLLHGLREGPLAGSPHEGSFVSGMLRTLRQAMDGAVAEVASYALCTSYLGIARMLLGEFATSAQLVDELYRFCDAQGGSAVSFAHSAQAALALGRGRFAEALRWVRLSERALDADRGELPPVELRRARAMVGAQSAWVLALTGSRDETGLLEQNLQTAQQADEAFVLHALAVPAVYHADRGELTLMLRARARFLEQCSRLRVAWHESLVYPTTTRCLIAAGLYARARDDLTAFDAVTPPGPFREAWVRILGGLLEVATGDAARGQADLAAAARLSGAADVGAIGWTVEALLGGAEGRLRSVELDEAERLAREALERLAAAEIGYLWGETRAHRVLARVALRRGDVRAGQTALEKAMAAAAPLSNPGEAAHLELLRAEVTLAGGDVKTARVHARSAELAFNNLGNGFWARRAAEIGPSSAGQGGGEPSTGQDTQVEVTESVTQRIG